MITYPFIPYPQALHDPNSSLNTLRLEEKVVLAKLLNLQEYAQHRTPPQVDRDGKVFVIFSLKQVKDYVGCGTDKAEKILTNLESKGYIRRIRQGLGKANRIYINDLDLGHCNPPKKPLPDNLPPTNELYATLKAQIDYDMLCRSFDPKVINSILNTLFTSLHIQNTVAEVAGRYFDINFYRARLLSTRSENIIYVYNRYNKLSSTPYSPYSYLLARLWESFDCLDLPDSAKQDNTPQGNMPSFQFGQAEDEMIKMVLQGE